MLDVCTNFENLKMFLNMFVLRLLLRKIRKKIVSFKIANSKRNFKSEVPQICFVNKITTCPRQILTPHRSSNIIIPHFTNRTVASKYQNVCPCITATVQEMIKCNIGGFRTKERLLLICCAKGRHPVLV